MKKAAAIIGILAAILVIAAFIFSKSEKQERTIMSFPEELGSEGCLALNYHRVREDRMSTKILESLSGSEELSLYSVYDDEFEYQMKTLKEEKAYFATVEEILHFQEQGEFPDRCVWISFDDIDRTVYEQAFPVMKKYEIPFTIFLIASQVGNDSFNNLEMASWEEIQEMVDSGLTDVGTHSYDMHYLEGEAPSFFEPANYEAFVQDLVKSRETIESNLTGVEVLDYAYPFGEGKAELAELIRDNGFRTAFILAPRVIDPDNDPYWMNRILVDPKIFEAVVLPWIH